jgi:hypothetical protein
MGGTRRRLTSVSLCFDSIQRTHSNFGSNVSLMSIQVFTDSESGQVIALNMPYRSVIPRWEGPRRDRPACILKTRRVRCLKEVVSATVRYSAHIPIHRLWAVARLQSDLTVPEHDHMLYCEACYLLLSICMNAESSSGPSVTDNKEDDDDSIAEAS